MKHFTTFDGLSIAYDEWGSDPARPPVVLHHGFAVDATVNWVAPGIVAALTAAGHRVVGIDARGHGRSDKPHDPARYGEGAMVKDLHALFDLLAVDEVHLVGYSMGAVVSLITAAADRRVSRLVVGGVGAGVVELGGVDTRVSAPAAIAAVLLAEDPAEIQRSPVAAFRALADAVGADRQALAAHARAVHAGSIPLGTITAPALVLAGEKDPLAARPEVLAAALPDARLQLVPGDHLGAVRDPLFARSIVDFLN